MSRPEMMALIRAVSAEAGIDPVHLYAIVKVESSFKEKAVNLTGGDKRRGGAWGPAQMTLATARSLGFTGTTGELAEPLCNLRLAARHIKELSGRARTDVLLVDIAALYNSGRRFRGAPEKTRTDYVPKVLVAAAGAAKDPLWEKQ